MEPTRLKPKTNRLLSLCKNKPFVNTKKTLDPKTAKLLRKRFTRYISKIEIPIQETMKKNPIKIKHVKLFRSIQIPAANQIKATLLLKVFKSQKNLANLSLSIGDIANSKGVDHLRMLGILSYIKKLNLRFIGSEDMFLRHFTMPKSIEAVRLELRQFDLKNMFLEEHVIVRKYDFEENSKFKRFFKQWERLENLRDLRLCFEMCNNKEIISPFYGSIFRRLKRLKSLYYQQIDNPDDSNISVDFNCFWKAIVSFKNSLENLSIMTPHISPFTSKDISLEMPTLKSINIEASDQRFCADNIIKVWKESPFVKTQKAVVSLNIKRIDIRNDKTLRAFLDVITEVPNNLNLNLEVYVHKTVPLALTTSLCKFLTQTQMEGWLQLYVDEKGLSSWENLKRIENAAVKNKTLKFFDFRSGNRGRYLAMQRGKLISRHDSWIQLIYESEQ